MTTALVTDDVLAAARATLQRLHTTTATHDRRTDTTSASGDTATTWQAQGSIACRVETDMGDTQQARMGAGDDSPSGRVVYEYVVYVAHDADVRTGDRLTLASGVTLSVVQSSRGQSQAFVQALYCTEAP